jgi:hypothetical protein
MGEDRERRSHFRLYTPFSVTVRGRDANGETFRIATVLENISARGLYVRLERRVEVGARVFSVVHFTADQINMVPGPRVAMRGVVIRTEPLARGVWGVAVAFTWQRFL